MTTLLEITEDLGALDSILTEAGGDISDPAVLEAVDLWFSELDTAMSDKADNYAALITEIEARSAIRKSEATRLAARAKIDANNAVYLKSRLKEAMEYRGMKKLETARYRISVAGNGGKQPLDIHGEVPRDYCKEIPQTYSPDKDMIRDALENDVQLDFATLSDRGTRLAIR